MKDRREKGSALYTDILSRNEGPMYREKWEAAFLDAYRQGRRSTWWGAFLEWMRRS